MTVHLPRSAPLAAALVSLVAIALPLNAGAQGAPATPQWATYLGGTDADHISAVTQIGGDVLVVGTTASQSLAATATTMGPRATGLDIFVARFDSDGRPIQEFPFQIFGGTGADEPMAAVAGPDDALYIVGKTTSSAPSVTGSGTVIGSSLGGIDAFLVRINPLGTPDWFLFLSGSGDDVATGVTVLDGNVYVSGWTTSQDLLGRVVSPPAETNGFVVRVEPTAMDATIGWGGVPQLIGGGGTDTLHGITWGMGNKLVAVGTTTSTTLHINMATNVYHGGSSDAFAVMLDADAGTIDWLTFIGGAGTDEGNAIATGLGQSFVVAGTTNSTPSGPPSADRNAFVSWLKAGRGEFQLQGGGADDEALAVTTDAYGTAYVGGRTASQDFPGAASGFDPTMESGAGVREGFVWMVPPLGGAGWASFVGGTETDAVKSLSFRASNRLILGLDTDSSSGLPGPFGPYDSSPNAPPEGYILSVAVNDPSPPSPVGEVFDRLQLDDIHEDEEETSSTSSIFANWTAFTDANSGIAKYEWAIGTELNPTQIMPFTSVDLQLSAMASGLTLTVGQKYFVTVRAQNGHGLTSIASSNGITVSTPASDGGTGGDDGGTGGDDGGTGGTDGGTGGTDGGTGGIDGGKDGGTGGPDGGEGPGEETGEPVSPVGWALGCASAGGAGPLFLGLIALMLLRRRLGQR